MKRAMMATIECRVCGGSGGGEGYYRCGSCRGSGLMAVDPDHYGVCEICEEIEHEDYLTPCEDKDGAQVCERCVKAEELTCPGCEGAFLEGVEIDGKKFCTEFCHSEWLQMDHG